MSRFNEVKVGTKEGFTTYYDPGAKKFLLRDLEDHEVATGNTQEEVERQIPALKAFKLPIPAFMQSYGRWQHGRITSLNLQDGRAWFSFDDKKLNSSEKIWLGSAKAYVITPHNEMVVGKVEDLSTQQALIGEEIKKLEATMVQRIDHKYFTEAKDESAEH